MNAPASITRAEADAIGWRIARMVPPLCQGVVAAEIARTDRLAALGLDHATLPALMIGVEDELGITIEDQELSTDATFGALVDLALQKLGE